MAKSRARTLQGALYMYRFVHPKLGGQANQRMERKL